MNVSHDHGHGARGAAYGLPVGLILGVVIGAAIVLTEKWSDLPVI